MKKAFLFAVILIFSAKVFCYHQSSELMYCVPTGDRTTNLCYKKILDELKPEKNIEFSNITVEMMRFNLFTFAFRMLGSHPSQINVSLNGSTNRDISMNANIKKYFLDKNVAVSSVDNSPGIYHIKLATILKHNIIEHTYQLVTITGSFNYTENAAARSYENIIIMKSNWVTSSDSDYYELIDEIAGHICHQYPSISERRLVINDGANVNKNASGFGSYSDSCDFYPSDTMLNTIDKLVCNDSQSQKIVACGDDQKTRGSNG